MERGAVLALGVLAASSVGSAGTPPGRVLVVSVGPQEVTDDLSAPLAAWVLELTGETVVMPGDITDLAPFGAPRPLAECRRAACFSSWALAAGCAHAVAVDVEPLVGKWRVTARLVDSDTGALIKRQSLVVRGGPRVLRPTVADLLGQLFDKPTPTSTPHDPATRPPPPGAAAPPEGDARTPDGSTEPSRMPVVRPLLTEGATSGRVADEAAAEPGDPGQRSRPVAARDGPYARRLRLTADPTRAIGSVGTPAPSAPSSDRAQRLPQNSISPHCRRGVAWACDELGRRVAVDQSASSLRVLTSACDRGSAPGCEALIAIDEQLPFGNGARVTGTIMMVVGGTLAGLGLLTNWAGNNDMDTRFIAAASIVVGGIVGSTGAIVYIIGATKGSHSLWRSAHPQRSPASSPSGLGVRFDF